MKKELEDLLTRGVHDVTVKNDLIKKLESGKKLRVKHGVDPTTADLHLGYAVVYRKLRAFQELGHTVIFLIGDFTGRFGDPTDKSESRELRSKHDVESAAKSYIDQIGMMLDTKKLEIRRNSEWYDKMSAERLLQIMSEFTVAQMLERDMFVNRMKEGKAIGLHEPVYPVLQAWDSFELKSDVTVIGTDQTFNELQARVIQERHGKAPQDVMSMDILVGTDGVQKMSQSLGNGIMFKDTPEDMYGKIMSIPDSAVQSYFTLLTDVSFAEVKKMMKDKKNIMQTKKTLAKNVVEQFHGSKEAVEAEKHFQRTIQNKEAPAEVEVLVADAKNVQDAVAQLFDVSQSEARRLIEQNGIQIDGKIATNPVSEAQEGVYKKGKRHFKRLKKK